VAVLFSHSKGDDMIVGENLEKEIKRLNKSLAKARKRLERK